jgi:hypothetical protein
MDKDTKDAIDAAVKAALSGDALKTAVTGAVTDLVKPINDSLGQLTQNQKVIADTLANDKKAADEAAAKAAAATGTGGDPAKGEKKPEPLTAEAVAKIVQDQISASQKAQADQVQDRTARETFVASAESGLGKIANFAKSIGVDLATKLGGDKSKWAEEAKNLVKGFEGFVKENKIQMPSIGGATREGGEKPGTEEGAPAGKGLNMANYLPENLKKQADAIVLPTQPVAAAPAK